MLLSAVSIQPKARWNADGPSAVSQLFSIATYVFYGRNGHLRYPTGGSYAPGAHMMHVESARNTPMRSPIWPPAGSAIKKKATNLQAPEIAPIDAAHRKEFETGLRSAGAYLNQN